MVKKQNIKLSFFHFDDFSPGEVVSLREMTVMQEIKFSIWIRKPEIYEGGEQ